MRTEQTVLVSHRVEDGAVRPGFLYREDPDTDGDSGWRALVGDETRAEVDDPLSILPRRVGEFVARWPEVRALLESDPAPGEWRWDGGAEAYVPLEQ